MRSNCALLASFTTLPTSLAPSTRSESDCSAYTSPALPRRRRQKDESEHFCGQQHRHATALGRASDCTSVGATVSTPRATPA